MQKQHGFRVLMVGEHAEFIELLRGDGHEVIVTPDDARARDTSARVGLDVVVLDLDLPGGDGYALAREIRGISYWRKPMFIALGLHASEESYRRCKEAGIDLHLVKPVAPELIRGFLGRLQAVVQDFESFDPAI